jgi:hypothetical protein
MRYELLVERHLTPATLATFPVALTTTTVPRNRVRRLRVHADQDLADVVRRLTERRIQLLEIRRCPPPATPPPPASSRPLDGGEPGTVDPIALPPVDAQPAGRRTLATVTALAPAALRRRRTGGRETPERCPTER